MINETDDKWGDREMDRWMDGWMDDSQTDMLSVGCRILYPSYPISFTQGSDSLLGAILFPRGHVPMSTESFGAHN